MRWGRTVAVALFVVALAACGGGDKKSDAAATGSSSDASLVSADPGASAATDGGSAGDAAGGGDSPVVGADTGGGGEQGGGQAAGSTPAPTPPGLKPFAGKYRFQVTGQGAPTEIVVTIEDLSDTDQRTTTPSGQGDSIQTLRFLADQIQLVSLEMKGAFPKTFNGPVMFAPVPADVGATWSWDLTSTDKLTHVHQSSRVDRTETVVVAGQSVDTLVVETDLEITGDVNAKGHITSWASPAYKLSVRTHNILNVTTPVQISSDTTAEVLDLRPS